MNAGLAEVLAARIPDQPRWVDLRGLLLSGSGEIFVSPDHESAAVLSRSLRFIALWGPPSRRQLEAAIAAAAAGELDVLVDDGSAPQVAPWLPGWERVGAILHRAGPTVAAAAVPEAIATVDLDRTTGCDLSGWESPERQEIEWTLAHGRPAAGVVVESRLVAYCAAAVETESLWDVSVATRPEHRRRGLAAACFHHLKSRLEGKQPVWGSRADNLASRRLAARLGFVPDSTMTAFLRPEGP
ncbi:MAG: GNAT family N-acetyltransferase [Acidobacteriota bacterium]